MNKVSVATLPATVHKSGVFEVADQFPNLSSHNNLLRPDSSKHILPEVTGKYELKTTNCPKRQRGFVAALAQGRFQGSTARTG
jgi:hypothetical protein